MDFICRLRHWITQRATAGVASLHPLLLASLAGCYSIAAGSRADYAEQLVKESRYEEAVIEYRHHIENRLADTTRPDWENPYFYLLLIADLELQLGKPASAVQSCLEAQRQAVDRGLISDRIRSIAIWHRKHGDLQAAFEVLKEHRELDPLLFDALLDRVGRELNSR